MYETLQKDFKRVGQAFQNQKEQNQELTEQLAEREKEAEELANLVRNHLGFITTSAIKLCFMQRQGW